MSSFLNSLPIEHVDKPLKHLTPFKIPIKPTQSTKLIRNKYVPYKKQIINNLKSN